MNYVQSIWTRGRIAARVAIITGCSTAALCGCSSLKTPAGFSTAAAPHRTLKLADKYVEKGRLDTAETLYREVLSEHPDLLTAEAGLDKIAKLRTDDVKATTSDPESSPTPQSSTTLESSPAIALETAPETATEEVPESPSIVENVAGEEIASLADEITVETELTETELTETELTAEIELTATTEQDSGLFEDFDIDRLQAKVAVKTDAGIPAETTSDLIAEVPRSEAPLSEAPQTEANPFDEILANIETTKIAKKSDASLLAPTKRAEPTQELTPEKPFFEDQPFEDAELHVDLAVAVLELIDEQSNLTAAEAYQREQQKPVAPIAKTKETLLAMAAGEAADDALVIEAERETQPVEDQARAKEPDAAIAQNPEPTASEIFETPTLTANTLKEAIVQTESTDGIPTRVDWFDEFFEVGPTDGDVANKDLGAELLAEVGDIESQNISQLSEESNVDKATREEPSNWSTVAAETSAESKESENIAAADFQLPTPVPTELDPLWRRGDSEPRSNSRDISDLTAAQRLLEFDGDSIEGWKTIDELLTLGDPGLRSLTVLALCELPSECRSSVVQRLRTVLAIENSDELKASAALALGGMGASAEPAVPLLRHIVLTGSERASDAASVTLTCLGFEVPESETR